MPPHQPTHPPTRPQDCERRVICKGHRNRADALTDVSRGCSRFGWPDYTPSRVEPLDAWDAEAAQGARRCAGARPEYAAARFVPPVRWVTVPLPRDRDAADGQWRVAVEANEEFQQARRFAEYQRRLELRPQGVPGLGAEEELRRFREGQEGGAGAKGAALEVGGGGSLWEWLGGIAGAGGEAQGGAGVAGVPTLLAGGGGGGGPPSQGGEGAGSDGEVLAFTVGGAEEGETEGEDEGPGAGAAAAGFGGQFAGGAAGGGAAAGEGAQAGAGAGAAIGGAAGGGAGGAALSATGAAAAAAAAGGGAAAGGLGGAAGGGASLL